MRALGKWRFCFLNLGLTLTVLTGPASAAMIPAPGEVQIVLEAQEQIYRMSYEAAEATLTQGLPLQSPARAYFTGIVCMNRFLDLGDTVALRRAEQHWERLNPRGAPSPLYRKVDDRTLKLYRGLTGVQLSYAASLRGQRLRSTSLALASQSLLEEVQSPDAKQGNPQGTGEIPEAKATLMLFDYYRSRLLDKIPFVDEPDFDTKTFTRLAEASPALRGMLLGSLFWVHFDHGRFHAAEAITTDFLTRHSGNRMARQLRASVLYKSGRLAEAEEAFESLKSEYAALPRAPGTLPLGYYRAVGNLARVYAARGNRRETAGQLAEWKRAEGAGLMPWLPSVLKKDLARM